MYYILLAMTGALIALMVMLNGLLFQDLGMTPALIAIHVSGLMAALLWPSAASTAASKLTPRGANVPWWMFTAGVIGVVLTGANIYIFAALGVTTSLSFRLLGQLLCAFIIDGMGIPGFQHHPITRARLWTLGLSLVGCLTMADLQPLYLPLIVALGAGVLLFGSSVMNAALSQRIGVLPTVRLNFLTGLLSSLPLLWWWPGEIAAGAGILSAFSRLSLVPVYVLCGGGLCGVVVVASMTYLLRRVSLLYSALTLFSGQLLAGYMLDAYLTGRLPGRQMLVGGALLLLGLMLEPLRHVRWLHRTRSARSAHSARSARLGH